MLTLKCRPLPKPWIMWPYEAIGELQPTCEGTDVGNTVYSCREREIWKQLYTDFRRRRKDLCKLLSVPAPDWHPYKKSVGAS